MGTPAVGHNTIRFVYQDHNCCWRERCPQVQRPHCWKQLHKKRLSGWVTLAHFLIHEAGRQSCLKKHASKLGQNNVRPNMEPCRTEFLLKKNTQKKQSVAFTFETDDVCILKTFIWECLQKKKVCRQMAAKEHSSLFLEVRHFSMSGRGGRKRRRSAPFSSERCAKRRPWSCTATPPCLRAWRPGLGRASRSLGRCLSGGQRKWWWRRRWWEGTHWQSGVFSCLKQPSWIKVKCLSSSSGATKLKWISFLSSISVCSVIFRGYLAQRAR